VLSNYEASKISLVQAQSPFPGALELDNPHVGLTGHADDAFDAIIPLVGTVWNRCAMDETVPQPNESCSTSFASLP